jgi:metal-responsive CopG/Arc/MetJ family transcriptional regulator
MRRSFVMSRRTIRTTVALPADLLEAVDQAVGAGKARSRNELIAIALRHELAAQERAAIDDAFAAMAQDPAYQAEAKNIATELSPADWEAWQLGEGKR